MFRWIDYDENSVLFVVGIGTNIAILRHKDFRLHDNITGQNIKIRSSCLDEAKIDSENFLEMYWKKAYKELDKILKLIGE